MIPNSRSSAVNQEPDQWIVKVRWNCSFSISNEYHDLLFEDLAQIDRRANDQIKKRIRQVIPLTAFRPSHISIVRSLRTHWRGTRRGQATAELSARRIWPSSQQRACAAGREEQLRKEIAGCARQVRRVIGRWLAELRKRPVLQPGSDVLMDVQFQWISH